MAVAPGGARLATGGNEDNKVRVFEIPSGKEVATGVSAGGPTYSLAWSGDGKQLVTHHADFVIRAWRADNVTEQAAFGKVIYQSHALAASPDGRWVAYPTENGSIVIRDCATWKEARRLEGHEGGTVQTAFHPGSRYLSSAGANGSLRFWDLGTGLLLAERAANLGEESRLGFTADGRGLVAAGAKGVALFGPGK